MSDADVRTRRVVALVRRAGGWSPTRTIPIGFGIVVGVTVLDWATGPDLSPVIGYLFAVVLLALTAPRPVADVAAALGAIANLAVTVRHPDAGEALITGANAVLRFVFLEFATQATAVLHAVVVTLDREARTDPMTGLLNRRGLLEALNHAMAMADRLDSPMTIVALDLDGLKRVNDTRGHDAGDELIKEAARMLQAVARATDIVARTGGDEFVLALPNTEPERAHSILDRVLADPECPPMSIGMCRRDARDTTAARYVLDRADVALTAAKQARRRKAAGDLR